MTYAFVQDVPIGAGIYDEIAAGLGNDPPDGLILHVAQVLDEGHLRYLDVWESEAAWHRFVEERLHPVVGPVLARHHVRPDGEPPTHTVQIADLWIGAGVEPGRRIRPLSATRAAAARG